MASRRAALEYGDDSYDQEAQAGVNSLARIRSDARELDARNLQERRFSDAERHAYQMEAYRAAAERVREAREERQFMHDMAQAKHAIEMHQQSTEALKKLSTIDMRGEHALEELQKVQAEHPEAFVGKDSLASTYKDYWDRAMAHQNAREAAAERAQAKKDSDAARMEATKGMEKKRVTVDGVEYESPKAEKGQNVDKIRSSFEKASDAYHAMDDAIIQGGGAATAAQLDKRNFYRNQMISQGKKLSTLDPDSADEVNGAIKESILTEHNALQTKLEDPSIKLEDKKKLLPQINPMKKILGYKPVDFDEKGNAITLGDKTTPVPTPDKVTPSAPQPKTFDFDPNSHAADSVPDLGVTPPAAAPVTTPAVVLPAATPATVPPPPAPAVTSEPHPYEGKRVLQKSTGLYGTFKDGQFTPEAQ